MSYPDPADVRRVEALARRDALTLHHRENLDLNSPALGERLTELLNFHNLGALRGHYRSFFGPFYRSLKDRAARNREREARWLVRKRAAVLREYPEAAAFLDNGPEYARITADDVLRRWPRICAHVICQSLGYAVPRVAAYVVQSALQGMPCYCEWCDACFGLDSLIPLIAAIAGPGRHDRPMVPAGYGRHGHHGPMAEYRRARAIVDEYNQTGRSPNFASWF